MYRILILITLFLQALSLHAQESWQAKWITCPGFENESNAWFCFRKDFSLEKLPRKAVARIAIDSKYWLWMNGKMVVFEGGLKRGPNPKDTYYDTINLSPYLTKGSNSWADVFQMPRHRPYVNRWL